MPDLAISPDPTISIEPRPSRVTVQIPGWLYALNDRGVRALVVLAAAAGGGFVALALGWVGVAARSRVGLQLPFVVSGAFGGIALAACALSLAGVHLDRRAAAAERARVDGMIRDVARTGDALVDVLAARHAGPAGVADLVVNRVTVHRPDCRYAAGRELPALDHCAAPGELRACRACRPTLPFS